MGLKEIAKIARVGFLKNSPQILTGIGVTGIFTTASLAVKASIDSADIFVQDIPKKDKLQRVWKRYIPAGVVGLVSAFCVIESCKIGLKRNAALLSLYTVTEAAMREYQEKVKDMIGAGKELRIRDNIAAERIKQNPPSVNEIICTGFGKTLCYDAPSGRYFEADVEVIRQKENEINHRLRTDMQITLNELYFELGLPQTKLGDLYGWDIDKDQLTFRYSSQLTEGNRPCLVIDYNVSPIC